MRYQNWDVLIFPDQCKIPLQEFKTACQVIQDPGEYRISTTPFSVNAQHPADKKAEPHSPQNNPLLLPTVTSFVPSLTIGAPFRISIHSWQNPDVSRYIRLLRKPSDQIIFEARLFIDGRIVG
jgi:hypothetical protein